MEITSKYIENIGIQIKANRIKAENDAKACYGLIEKLKKSFDEFDELLKTKGILK